jgi:diadenosine tetraphosphate (Ap4A) HIT family hydrolase
MNKNCGTCTILTSDNDDIVVIKTKFWRVALERNQAYLGQSFVTLLDHKSSLTELTSEEWDDFREIVKKLEAATTAAFGATHFNWTCLMNEAYSSTPAIPHVHWHIFPRYERPVTVNDVEFTDTEFGRHYQDRRFSVDRPTLEVVGNKLKQALQA